MTTRMLEFVGAWALGQVVLATRAADGGADMPTWADLVIRLGSYGALLALVFWLVKIHIPQIRKDAQEDRALAQEDRTAQMKANADNAAAFQDAIGAFRQQLSSERERNAAMEQRMQLRDQQMTNLLAHFGCQDQDCKDRT